MKKIIVNEELRFGVWLLWQLLKALQLALEMPMCTEAHVSRKYVLAAILWPYG